MLAVLRCVAFDVTVNVVALEPLYVVLPPESPVPAVLSVRVLGSLVVKSRAASTSSFVNAAATPVALNNSDWFVASLILNDGAVTWPVTPKVVPTVAALLTSKSSNVLIFPVEFNVPELVTLPLTLTENLLEPETDKSKAPPIFKLPAITVFPVAPATVNLLVFNVKPPAVDVKLPRKVALPLVSIFNLVSAGLPPEASLPNSSLLKLAAIGFASFQA